MNKFTFDVTEVRKGVVTVEAATVEEAEAKLYDMDLNLDFDEIFVEPY